jgi:DNA-binding CsgD family transcriptional regulator
MELLERDDYLDNLSEHYCRVENGNGHTVFLTGEAGIGKTSLVNHFIKRIENSAFVYSGACDSLFTPRPLGPLFDIADQIGPSFSELLKNEKDRSAVFAALVQKLSISEKPIVLIFEDIHWADEATLDLIKFLARRIYRHKCLFLLTYRDGEINSGHPLGKIFGELPSGHFSKVLINGFSKKAVDYLATRIGYAHGEQLYALTGGNPFYVTEILASHTPGIPERVKDSILAVFHSRNEDTKALWEFFSILPTSRIELSIAKRIESDFANSIDLCLAYGVIVSRPGYLSFKHELFRLAIEGSLPQAKRRALHKKMLDILLEVPSASNNLAQLVHHARYADEKELVAKIAPEAAREAAAVGSHIEASKLYSTAIEYTDKQDSAVAELYERHAYECYLTNQIVAAITSQQRALDIWRERKVSLKEGDTLRFLSRLWSYQGNPEKAIALAMQSIEVLENGFPTRERVSAYSNLAQLSMFADHYDKALHWGNKAIDLAMRMGDDEILAHALNSVGTLLLKSASSESQGEENLKRSLSIALENGFHEHAASAYVNLASSFISLRRYEKAMAVFDVGVKYCEERDLDSWKYYIVSCKAQLLLETGHWDEALVIAKSLENNTNHHVKIRTFATLARLAMRRGEFEEARILIGEAKAMAMPTHEGHRIIPVLTAALELCWISGDVIPMDELRAAEDTLSCEKNNLLYCTELDYWERKCGIPRSRNSTVEFTGPFKLEHDGNWRAAAEVWKKLGCPYEQALALFEGDEEQQKQALIILDELGASAVHEMLKLKLKLKGVKNIPRGPRESTRSNPAQLTNRHIDVLVLLKEGLQNAEIADKLFISSKTVDNHISSILSKLGVNTRAKAVHEAKRLGILN